MIIYCSKDFKLVELNGTQRELIKIYEEIQKMMNNPALMQIQFHAEDKPSEWPNTTPLTSLIIKIGDTPICVSIEDETMVITSSQRWLGNLSSYFDFRETSDPGYHVNLDVHWGNDCIHPDCIDTEIGIHYHNNSQR